MAEDHQYAQVVRRFDPQSGLLRAWKLTGGVSAQTTALEYLRSDGQTRTVVVRRHGEVDLRQQPRVAASEFRLLQLLAAQDVAAPAPVYLDESREIFPTPYIVIGYLDGAPDFAPSNLPDYILQFTTNLHRIHSLDVSKLDLSFLPREEERCVRTLSERPARLDESLDEGRIRDALEAGWPSPQRNPAVLLHGDFWPGNVLWRDGRLVGIVDWEDATVGEPLVDLANSRLEVLWVFGTDAMRDFTRHYQAASATDLAALPLWDLFAALRPAGKIAGWAADEATEERMRGRHHWFVVQALEKLLSR